MNAADLAILGLPFVAGLLVLVTHVPLGMQVLDRGIVFIDLAIAQIAGLGVIAADALGFGAQGWVMQASAVGAALLGAALLTWTERRVAQQQEALIGVLFVLASCAGILLLAHNPHGGEHLKELLVGQILWVGGGQVLGLAAVTVAVLLALRAGALRRFGRFGFYGVFAVAVTASVQLVGVFLVFSALIVPALATRAWSGAHRLAWAYALGAAGFALGLALSAWLDLPSGALIVWALGACGLLVALLAPRATEAAA